ncbi:MAG: alpha/beta hydrolase [Dehalococcoidia bacterium]
MGKERAFEGTRERAKRSTLAKILGWLRRHRLAVTLSIGFVFALLMVAVGVVGWIGSERAIHPERKIEEHTLAEYPFAEGTEEIHFQSLDGTPLAGWFISGGGPNSATVILLHGYGRSRAELLPHADYLHQADYNVLMFDFRNRGESGGDAVTVGLKEPLDVRGAVSYLLTRSDIDPERIAVQGVSLGASAGILAMADDPRIAAIVAESAFTDLKGAISRSFEHFIDLPPFPFAPATVFITERRLGADADDVRPVDAIKRLGQRPIFIIDDLEDKRIPVDSGRRLYEAAPGPKELWLIGNAGHVDGFKLHPEEYERRVLKFYQEHLGGPMAPVPAGNSISLPRD